MIEREFHCMNLLFRKFQALRSKNEQLNKIFSLPEGYNRFYMVQKRLPCLMKDFDDLSAWTTSLTLPRHNRGIRRILQEFVTFRRRSEHIGKIAAMNDNIRHFGMKNHLKQLVWPVPD